MPVTQERRERGSSPPTAMALTSSTVAPPATRPLTLRSNATAAVTDENDAADQLSALLQSPKHQLTLRPSTQQQLQQQLSYISPSSFIEARPFATLPEPILSTSNPTLTAPAAGGVQAAYLPPPQLSTPPPAQSAPVPQPHVPPLPAAAAAAAAVARRSPSVALATAPAAMASPAGRTLLSAVRASTPALAAPPHPLLPPTNVTPSTVMVRSATAGVRSHSQARSIAPSRPVSAPVNAAHPTPRGRLPAEPLTPWIVRLPVIGQLRLDHGPTRWLLIAITCLSLAWWLLLPLTAHIIIALSIIGWSALAWSGMSYVTERGLLSFIPGRVRHFLLHNSLLDLSQIQWSTGTFTNLLTLFLFRLDEASVTKLVNTLPASTKATLLRKGIARLAPLDVQRVLFTPQQFVGMYPDVPLSDVQWSVLREQQLLKMAEEEHVHWLALKREHERHAAGQSESDVIIEDPNRLSDGDEWDGDDSGGDERPNFAAAARPPRASHAMSPSPARQHEFWLSGSARDGAVTAPRHAPHTGGQSSRRRHPSGGTSARSSRSGSISVMSPHLDRKYGDGSISAGGVLPTRSPRGVASPAPIHGVKLSFDDSTPLPPALVAASVGAVGVSSGDAKEMIDSEPDAAAAAAELAGLKEPEPMHHSRHHRRMSSSHPSATAAASAGTGPSGSPSPSRPLSSSSSKTSLPSLLSGSVHLQSIWRLLDNQFRHSLEQMWKYYLHKYTARYGILRPDRLKAIAVTVASTLFVHFLFSPHARRLALRWGRNTLEFSMFACATTAAAAITSTQGFYEPPVISPVSRIRSAIADFGDDSRSIAGAPEWVRSLHRHLPESARSYSAIVVNAIRNRDHRKLSICVGVILVWLLYLRYRRPRHRR